MTGLSFRISFHSSPPIHLLVILHIFPRRTLSHPLLMVLVPLDRQLNSISEHRSRRPSQLSHSLRRINRISLIVPLPVRHISNKTLRLTKLLQNDLHDLDIRFLIMPAEIVYFSNSALFQHSQDSAKVHGTWISVFLYSAVLLHFYKRFQVSEQPSLLSFIQGKEIHYRAAIFRILIDQYHIGRVAPASDSVSASQQLIRCHIQHVADDQDLLAHRVRLLPLPVTYAALGNPRLL